SDFVGLRFNHLYYPARLTLNALHKSVILNPCLLSLLIVWYSASYLVCLTSTLFALLSTFLGRHFLLLNIHYALLMQQFQFLTFLHLFVSNLIYGVHVYQRARQGRVFSTFEPMTKCYYKLRYLLLQSLHMFALPPTTLLQSRVFHPPSFFCLSMYTPRTFHNNLRTLSPSYT